MKDVRFGFLPTTTHLLLPLTRRSMYVLRDISDTSEPFPSFLLICITFKKDDSNGKLFSRSTVVSICAACIDTSYSAMVNDKLAPDMYRTAFSGLQFYNVFLGPT